MKAPQQPVGALSLDAMIESEFRANIAMAAGKPQSQNLLYASVEDGVAHYDWTDKEIADLKIGRIRARVRDYGAARKRAVNKILADLRDGKEPKAGAARMAVLELPGKGDQKQVIPLYYATKKMIADRHAIREADNEVDQANFQMEQLDFLDCLERDFSEFSELCIDDT